MMEAVLQSSMNRMRRKSRMCIRQKREMWRGAEMRMRSNTKVQTGASEVKVENIELFDSCIREGRRYS